MQKQDFVSKEGLKRVKRIKGQIEGVERMIGEGRPCLEIIQQVIAAKNALSSLAVEILTRQLCQTSSPEQRKKMLEKIIKEV